MAIAGLTAGAVGLWITRAPTPAGAPATEPAPAPGDAALAPLTAADLPEQAPVDRAALEAYRWERIQPMLPLPPSQGASNAMVMGTREREVGEATDPEVPRAYARQVFGSNTRTAEGQRVLAAALAKFPAHAPLQLLRGQVAMRMGAWDDARVALDQALALDPALAGAWASRARMHRLHGRLRAAFEDVTRGRAVAPDDVELALELVALHVAVGRGADAHAIAARAVELAPTDPQAWVALADTSGPADAYAHLGQAVRLDSSAGGAFKRLCVLGVELGRAEAERDCYQARLHGVLHDPDITLAESLRLERAGDLEGARNALWGHPRADADVRLLRKLAELHDRLGNRHSADEARGRACKAGDAASCPDAGVADTAGSADSAVTGD